MATYSSIITWRILGTADPEMGYNPLACLMLKPTQSVFVAPWTIPHQAPLPRIFQARILEHVADSYSRDLPDSGIKPASLVFPLLASRFFTTAPPDKYLIYTHIYT